MVSDEEVDWIGIAAAVELEEAEAEALLVVAGRSTKRKRPHDSDNNDHQQDIPPAPAFNLADVDSDPGTRKQIEEYATPEIRDEMRRAYLSKGVGRLYALKSRRGHLPPQPRVHYAITS